MPTYLSPSDQIVSRIASDRESGVKNPYRCPESGALRRNPTRDLPTLWRPAFVRDCEKILHLPCYNRYSDKTQVFSFLHNDDISRRALHVQLVSRIARNIGSLLGLDLDLIEAIALGHDLGHTPFGHAGERFLSEALSEKCGRQFHHNVQSVRVLDSIYARNVSLPVLDGILCHNGELPQSNYTPVPLSGFDSLDERMQRAPFDAKMLSHLVPGTLEGCVVRVCDIVAYLGKDRQDAQKAGILNGVSMFSAGSMGVQNAEIINNLTVSVIENSYAKPYISMDQTIYNQLLTAKQQNYEHIYRAEQVERLYGTTIRPMMHKLFDALLDQAENPHSLLFAHHINPVQQQRSYYTGDDYAQTDRFTLVTDYIASMTDDYFLALYSHLFPDSTLEVTYKSYFDQV